MTRRVTTLRCLSVLMWILFLNAPSNASEVASLVVYELSNPLLDKDALPPQVRVSTTGEISVFRPPGHKNPGLHRYVLAEAALSSLSRQVSALSAAPTAFVIDNADSSGPTTQSVNASDGKIETVHNTDPTTARVSFPQADQQTSRQAAPLNSLGGESVKTISMKQAGRSELLSADEQGSSSEFESLIQDLLYLYRLPTTHRDSNMEVDFER